ncbi:hypothetical protein [Frankia sp. Cas3]|uniref:type II toxin-antitoxin system VapC family toxin n=1 Tax=Frankia sp. Cas3 TaxID=3073926 RepID=UPI002AD4066B|nr:hypothetical protein [Frankia sp. Cas3]
MTTSIILTEVLRGHRRDAQVHKLLGGLRVDSVTPEIGRLAGELLGSLDMNNTVDAVVAMTALRAEPPVLVLTSDICDFERLLGERPDIRVVQV